jgi:hypothetical protein
MLWARIETTRGAAMSWSTRRWDTEAVLERLGAEQAVDALPRADIVERARLRLRLAELAAAVDRGDLPAGSATDEFRDVQQRAADRVSSPDQVVRRR